MLNPELQHCLSNDAEILNSLEIVKPDTIDFSAYKIQDDLENNLVKYLDHFSFFIEVSCAFDTTQDCVRLTFCFITLFIMARFFQPLNSKSCQNPALPALNNYSSAAFAKVKTTQRKATTRRCLRSSISSVHPVLTGA